MSILGEKYRVIVTKPIGSRHDSNPDIIYKVNYGIVEGVLDASGEPQEAYILGVDEELDTFEGRLIAICHRTNDTENKWIISNFHLTKEEILEQISFIESYFNVEIIV